MRNNGLGREERRVIWAASAGTTLDWVDFYLLAVLIPVISATFFAGWPEAMRDLFTLLLIATGFVVRPLGAVLFGHLGDRAGRKPTFLLTVLLMGSATFMIGVLPGSETIGIAAPILLVALRLLQGLAVGGEYGSAATYVAEHAPLGRRGWATGYIQVTATAGFFLALMLVLLVRSWMPESAFRAWGWRIPFLLSVILLGLAVWIRLQLRESAVWQRVRDGGKLSVAPWREVLGRWVNLRLVLLALFGMVVGQGAVWYSSQFYALVFLTSVLKVDTLSASLALATALLLACPFFVLFGHVSDRIGRKPVIIGGLVLAALSTGPLFRLVSLEANPELHMARARVPVVVQADPATCTGLLRTIGRVLLYPSAPPRTPCDLARAALGGLSASYTLEPVKAPVVVRIGDDAIPAAGADFLDQLITTLQRPMLGGSFIPGYPTASNPGVFRITGAASLLEPRFRELVIPLWLLAMLVTMVYGPIAAALVEMFPIRIRATGMSIPYHIGNGWVGGLLPASVVAISLAQGNPFAGLIYPITAAAASAMIGALLLPETAGTVDLDGDIA